MGHSGILRPVAFRPHLTMGLAFSGRGFGSQQVRIAYVGAGHNEFGVHFHK
jgi:hypothetical protein